MAKECDIHFGTTDLKFYGINKGSHCQLIIFVSKILLLVRLLLLKPKREVELEQNPTIPSLKSKRKNKKNSNKHTPVYNVSVSEG